MVTDNRLIYMISMAQQRIWTYLKKAFKAEGVSVTPAQAGILLLLGQKDGQSMTELSRAMAIDNSTITGLVDRLEKASFVSRSASEADRRMLRIYITPQGGVESNRAKAIIKKVNEDIQSGLSSKDIEIFKRVLISLFDKFNKNGLESDPEP